MGTMLLGATVLALIVYLSARSARASARAPGADPDAAAHAAASANLSADPTVLEAHAANAERAGYPQTAAAIRQRAARIRASTALAPARGKAIPSPIPEASAGAWTRFVDVVAGNTPADHVSARGDLGVFQMSLARLADLGYVTNAHRDPSGKWTADWVPPLSQERFVGDLQLQYQAFVKATQADRKAILAHHKDAREGDAGRPQGHPRAPQGRHREHGRRQDRDFIGAAHGGETSGAARFRDVARERW
jgi:hypothetical protein